MAKDAEPDYTERFRIVVMMPMNDSRQRDSFARIASIRLSYFAVSQGIAKPCLSAIFLWIILAPFFPVPFCSQFCNSRLSPLFKRSAPLFCLAVFSLRNGFAGFAAIAATIWPAVVFAKFDQTFGYSTDGARSFHDVDDIIVYHFCTKAYPVSRVLGYRWPA